MVNACVAHCQDVRGRAMIVASVNGPFGTAFGWYRCVHGQSLAFQLGSALLGFVGPLAGAW